MYKVILSQFFTGKRVLLTYFMHRMDYSAKTLCAWRSDLNNYFIVLSGIAEELKDM